MHWFYNLKISAKLIISFLIVAAIAGVVGGVALVNINNMSEADKLLYEENVLGIDYAANAGLQYQRMRFNSAKVLLLENTEEQNEIIGKINEHISKTEEYLKLYEDGIVSDVILSILLDTFFSYNLWVSNWDIMG